MNHVEQANSKNTVLEEIITKKEFDDTAFSNEIRIKKMKKFWPLLKAFILKERKPVLQDEKWQ
jgi:predicted HD phosphohydrolase